MYRAGRSCSLTDWVLPNYNLHGKGAIWHIRWKDAPKVERPEDPKKAIFSMHRPLREVGARKLAGDVNAASSWENASMMPTRECVPLPFKR